MPVEEVRLCSHCQQPITGSSIYYTDEHGKGILSCWNLACRAKHAESYRLVHAAELASLKERGLCRWVVSWIGYCGEKGYYDHSATPSKHVDSPVKAVEGTEFCAKHLKERCANRGCTNQAIGECEETYQFVCGHPYCETCGKHECVELKEARMGVP